MSSATSPDVVVIGAGIAGASAAYWLSKAARVVVLERESQPGYHSTGRSAALFISSLGPAPVRALTLATRPFFEQPPAGFADHPLLTPRGSIVAASQEQSGLLDEHFAIVREASATARRLTAAETLALVPVLRRDRLLGAVFEPEDADMDVHAIHQGFLRGIARQGGRILCEAEAMAIERHGGEWEVVTGGEVYRAPVLVNAAGA